MVMESDQFLDEFTKDQEYLNSVLAHLSEAQRREFRVFLASKLLQRFEERGSLPDLDRVIATYDEAIAFTPDGPLLASYLNNLGAALQRRFEWTGEHGDLDRAIMTNEQAVEATPNDHLARGGRLHNLAHSLQIRFELTGNLDDLDRAIIMSRHAVIETPNNLPNHAMFVNGLADKLRTRSERTGSLEDLNEAIRIIDQALPYAQHNNPIHAMCLNNLGIAMQRRFQSIGEVEDLNRAVILHDEAIASTQNSHPNLGIYLSNLGDALRIRFERTGSMDDLDRTIAINDRASTSLPPNHHHYATILNNMATALQVRFERIGEMSDMDRAITVNKRAVASISTDQPRSAIFLNNLGNLFRLRFHRFGVKDDLDQGITNYELALTSNLSNHPNRAKYLQNLGGALGERFELTDSMNDLDRAISTAKEAIACTLNDHPELSMYQITLANMLQTRFRRTGSIPDLNTAITLARQAVMSIPKDSSNYSMYLSNLGTALSDRYERIGSTDDLDNAVIMYENAVISSPNDHPKHRLYLINLGEALRLRFLRSDSLDDLNRAILVTDKAVISTPNDDASRASRLNNLGITLQNRYMKTGSMSDLDRTIVTIKEAITSTPSDFSPPSLYFSNLGFALHLRFQLTHVPGDLTESILMCERAVKTTAKEHPKQAVYLDNLGNALLSRFKQTGSITEFNRAIDMKEQAFATTAAPPSIRLRAASSCADALIYLNLYSRAKSLLRRAVNVLPMVSPRALQQTDRQYNISLFSNITSRAVSLCLADADDPYESLQVLELGRGILSSLQIESRSDISVLENAQPAMAKSFRELRDEIDPPSGFLETASIIDSSIGVSHPPQKPQRDPAILQQFDELLESIRQLEGFENFLRGPSTPELHAMAKDGPLVIFNVSDIRSDVFLVTDARIRTLHLPSFALESLKEFTNRFVSAIDDRSQRHYSHSNNEVKRVLEWLWDVAVKPALDELGFSHRPCDVQAWPRVWWVGSGLMNILPIHAAGYHESTPRKTALDRVISSYVPTIRSLSYARRRAVLALDLHERKDKAVVLSMPKTPGRQDLSYVQKEVEDLRYLFSKVSLDSIVMEKPKKESVLAALPSHSILHFACHGNSEKDPLQSYFSLQDEPLTVSDITSLNLTSAKFAYLSACHTSSVKDFTLLDESICLSSAIHLSGFSSVIGSLWSVQDDKAAEVSKTVYEWILDMPGLDARKSAEGLHKAILKLRDETCFMTYTDPLLWAPFIHIGL